SACARPSPVMRGARVVRSSAAKSPVPVCGRVSLTVVETVVETPFAARGGESIPGREVSSSPPNTSEWRTPEIRYARPSCRRREFMGKTGTDRQGQKRAGPENEQRRKRGSGRK